MIYVYLPQATAATDYKDHLQVESVHITKDGRWLRLTYKGKEVHVSIAGVVLEGAKFK